MATREQHRQLMRLFEETVLLYLRLTALAARMHGRGPLSGPRRTVLTSLARTGPQTVAQMARLRAQSRQRLQPLVNALLSEGLLEALPNPAHKQSPLIALTARGRQAVARFKRTEEAWRSRLAIATPARRIEQTVAVVTEVRNSLERLLKP